MSLPRVSDLVGIINKKFPFALAEDWDNVGLQVGDPAAEVSRVMVALDPTPEILDQALAANCQLLLTHHPLIFSPLRQITASSVAGSQVLKAAAGGLAVVAMHTNYDTASGGLNDILAGYLGLENLKPLKVSGKAELVKLVVFVPLTDVEQVRQEMYRHAEQIGNYRDCSFFASGEGTFLPLEGANPATGKHGVLEKVQEARLEFLVSRERLSAAIKTLLSVHPYEEPAFDCYSLINDGAAYGMGRIGKLAVQHSLSEFASFVKNRLGAGHIRVVGDPEKTVKKVALCSGSGASLMRDAIRAGADVMVTGDVKYHEAREAEIAGIAFVDAGHFSTEHIMVPAVKAFLQDTAVSAGYDIEVLASEVEKDPFEIFV